MGDATTANTTLKSVNMNLFGIDHDRYENLSKFYRLRRDKENLTGILNDQISGPGRDSEIATASIEKHNDHVMDTISSMNITPKDSVCTCGDKACFPSTLLIQTNSALKQVEGAGKIEGSVSMANEFAEFSKFANAF